VTYFVGLDVSVQETAVCVVDDVGKVICERKVPTEADDMAALLSTIGEDNVRVGIEAGSLSQWLVNGLTEAGLPVVCVETRHMKARSRPNRSTRAIIAQMMRVGLFKPVHVKTLTGQERNCPGCFA
jgi:transposase